MNILHLPRVTMKIEPLCTHHARWIQNTDFDMEYLKNNKDRIISRILLLIFHKFLPPFIVTFGLKLLLPCYMPCTFRWSAIMAFQSYLSFVALRNYCSSSVPLCTCSVIYSLIK